jgi:probable F420-dependent oxidoreductase
LAWVEPTAEAVARIEALPYDSLWVGGHVASDYAVAEPMVGLARLGALSQRLEIGTAILPLPLYPPAVVAKQIADIDRAAHGRVVLGVGVGGDFPKEFAACGIPFAERGARTDEIIPLLRRFWTAKPVSHRGPHYVFDDVRIHPAPAQGDRLPIVVAGRRPAAIRRAALLGDGWLPYLYSPRRYAESVTEIRRVASDVGRSLDDFRLLLFVFVGVDEDGDTARSELAAAMRSGGFDQLPPAALERVTVAGTPSEVAAQLQAFVAAGVQDLIIAPTPRPKRERIAGVLADQVIPLLRSGGGPPGPSEGVG